VPFFNSVKNVATRDMHEVHDYSDDLLVSTFNKFDDEY
jgi:hypothetical protein